MAVPLPPWRPLIRAAQQREGRSPAARWLQLATVALDGTPRVRTLVFRGWGGPDQLDLLTDARSAKAPELEQQPAMEICWLMPKAKQQFRLPGLLAAGCHSGGSRAPAPLAAAQPGWACPVGLAGPWQTAAAQ